MSFNQPQNRHQPPRGQQGGNHQHHQQARPWHKRTLYIVLFLIFLFPVGLILLWQRPDWSVRRRGLITAVIGVGVLFAAINPSPPPTTTTVLTTTAAGGATTAAAPSQAPSSSQPTTPTPAVTTPSPAPPKTTAAAAVPVRTTAALVRTSAAPAPVHTTAAPAPNPVCSPLTSKGKCYTAGEFCTKGERGTSGYDANGDPITCEDNNGWRWEHT